MALIFDPQSLGFSPQVLLQITPIRCFYRRRGKNSIFRKIQRPIQRRVIQKSPRSIKNILDRVLREIYITEVMLQTSPVEMERLLGNCFRNFGLWGRVIVFKAFGSRSWLSDLVFIDGGGSFILVGWTWLLSLEVYWFFQTFSCVLFLGVLRLQVFVRGLSFFSLNVLENIVGKKLTNNYDAI